MFDAMNQTAAQVSEGLHKDFWLSVRANNLVQWLGFRSRWQTQTLLIEGVIGNGDWLTAGGLPQTALDGLRLYWNGSGNFDGGSYKLVGVK
jgi:hypothetical protein